MNRDEIRKLLGGYATGTLSAEERNILYSAALEDQELFDALADEDVLRELLAEPETRQALLEELQQEPAFAALSAKDPRAQIELSAYAPPSPAPQAASFISEKKSPERNIWSYFTPARFALAGALAAIVLVVGGIQYKRSHAPVEIAANLAKSKTAEQDLAQPQIAERKAENRVLRSATKDEPSLRPAPRQVGSPKPQASPVSVGNRDERSFAKEGNSPPVVAGLQNQVGASAPKKLEKDAPAAEAARDELNQAVRREAAQRTEAVTVESSAAPVATTPIAPPPPTLSDRTAPSAQGQASASRIDAGAADAKEKNAERAKVATPVGPAQIVAGGLRSAAPPPPAPLAAARPAAPVVPRELDAKVTDINGTIVSINAGSNAGLRNGDAVEIVRDNRVIATVKLSQVGAAFAVGAIQRPADNPDTPRSGDVVRRPRPERN